MPPLHHPQGNTLGVNRRIIRANKEQANKKPPINCTLDKINLVLP